MRVGVVGAGISGLVCAKRLLELAAPQQQMKVTTLEWGRGPGGRTARRRVRIPVNPVATAASSCDSSNDLPPRPPPETPHFFEAAFDHAAPFFSARTNEFREGLLRQWQDQGLVAKWTTTNTAATTTQQEEYLWVGIPSNHAVAKGIVQDIESNGGSCLFGQHVQKANFDEDKKVWKVRVVDRNANDAQDAASTHTFDALVLSDKLLVLPNTYAILEQSDWKSLAIPIDLGSTTAVVLLVAFYKTTPISEMRIPGVLLREDKHPHSVLKTIVHDSAKPGRDDTGLDLWVVHSTHKYAASHLVGEQLDDVEAVQHEMLDAFLEALVWENDIAGETRIAVEELESRLAHVSVMAWDHAQPEDSKRLGTSHLLDASRRVGVCGDFFRNEVATTDDGDTPRSHGVEAAALSGLALAEDLAPLLV